MKARVEALARRLLHRLVARIERVGVDAARCNAASTALPLISDNLPLRGIPAQQHRHLAEIARLLACGAWQTD